MNFPRDLCQPPGRALGCTHAEREGHRDSTHELSALATMALATVEMLQAFETNVNNRFAVLNDQVQAALTQALENIDGTIGEKFDEANAAFKAERERVDDDDPDHGRDSPKPVGWKRPGSGRPNRRHQRPRGNLHGPPERPTCQDGPRDGSEVCLPQCRGGIATRRWPTPAIADALACFGVDAVPFRLTGVESRPESGNSQFLCFQRRTEEDLIVSGYKVLGSAQRKSRTAVLQHGSLLIHNSQFAPQLPGISDLLSMPMAVDQLISRIVDHLCERLGVDWREDDLSEQEKSAAKKISSERFSRSAWTGRR